MMRIRMRRRAMSLRMIMGLGCRLRIGEGRDGRM